MESGITYLSKWIYDIDQASLSSYDRKGNLSFTSEKEPVFLEAFEASGCKPKMLAYGEEHTLPVCFSTASGLVFAAVFHHEDNVLHSCYVLGPFFDQEMRSTLVSEALSSDMHMSVAAANHIRAHISEIPVLSGMVWRRYILLLEDCVNHRTIHMSDINHELLSPSSKTEEKQIKDRSVIWETEQALLAMVRNGDLDYMDALSDSAAVSNGVPIAGKDALYRTKMSVTVFISLVTRASIEGGLSPDEAYLLGDEYIQNLHDALTMEEIGRITLSMYDDFIHRVHDHNIPDNLSAPVKAACEYMELHAGDKITADTLAHVTGYTPYYLTRLFQKETGLSFQEYLQQVRIEKAKLYLTTTDLSVQEIAERLAFSSRSHFSTVFTKAVGLSPAAYRKAE